MHKFTIDIGLFIIYVAAEKKGLNSTHVGMRVTGIF